MSRFIAALIQMRVEGNKEKNVAKAISMIRQTAQEGAELVVLPELFNCPCQADLFPAYAEKRGGHTWQELSKAASTSNVYLVGGSMPEIDDAGAIYNTCFIFNRKGEQIGRHRKVHLFDINVTNGQVFKESASITPGNEITVVETDLGNVGVAICYDMRFPELSRLMALRGAKVIVFPAAFNMTTGPAHWEFSCRARALDNQVYLIATAPARDIEASYVSYGNSIVVSPWGDVLGRLDEKENVLMCEVDLDRLDVVRQEFPLLQHRRTDVYSVTEVLMPHANPAERLTKR